MLAFRLFALAIFLLPVAAAEAAAPAIEGYADYATFSRDVEALAKPGVAEVSSLGTTLGSRKLYLIAVGAGKSADKPAVLVVGNVNAPQLFGSELTVRMARRLIDRADKEADVKQLLERLTFYFIPRPSPDASEAFFQRPFREREGNLRATADPRDPDDAKDAAEDLNGDGLITMMRVANPTGRWRPHPDDSRVMIEVDPLKNEHGQYDLYVEGRHDPDAAADAASSDARAKIEGVAFDRNFPFRYPFFKPGAGPNAVSEIETRAVADFAFDHPNIAAVFCFSPEDNLMHAWKPGEDGRIRAHVQPKDAAHYEYISEKYRNLIGAGEAPAAPEGEGAFSEWAYYQYGRWSLAARGWWIPKVAARKTTGEVNGPDKSPDAKKPDDKSAADKDRSAAEKKADDKPAEKTGDDKQPTPRGGSPRGRRREERPSADASGGELVNALRWFDGEKIDAFVPWKPLEHPDFPGRKVEIGGFKPFLLVNPPAKQLDSLAEKHYDFLIELARLLPRIKISDVKAESIGSGLQRITVTVANSGYLPTASEMGETTKEIWPLILKLDLPKGTAYLKDGPQKELRPIAGSGKAVWTWLVRTPEGKPAKGTISVSAPAVGADSVTVELK